MYQIIEENFREIHEEVEQGGGLKTYSAKELRIAVGAGKMGPHVAQKIRSHLASFGLECSEIGMSQDQLVRVHKKGSPFDIWMRNALTPGEHEDNFLRAGLNRFMNQKSKSSSVSGSSRRARLDDGRRRRRLKHK